MKSNASEPPMTCRKRMQSMPKPGAVVAPGGAWEALVSGPRGIRHKGGESVDQARTRNLEPVASMARRSPSGRPHEARVPMRGTGAERPVVARKACNAPGAKGSCHPVFGQQVNRFGGRSPWLKTNRSVSRSGRSWRRGVECAPTREPPGSMTSRERVREEVEEQPYRIWNRMSSGSYVPPPVRRVMIPKADGRERPLGIPRGRSCGPDGREAVPGAEGGTLFHPDSYGYRPGKSALDAVGTCRRRCWRQDWVVDLDIRGSSTTSITR